MSVDKNNEKQDSQEAAFSKNNAMTIDDKNIRKTNIWKFSKFVVFFSIVSISQYFLNMMISVLIVGMGESKYIPGVGLAVLSLGYIYGLLGFLRVASVGFSAQAKYSNNDELAWKHFLGASVGALIFGLVLIVLQDIMIKGFIFLYKSPPHIADVATEYYNVIVWASPVHLLNFVIAGWLMGRGSIFRVIIIQIIGTAANIGFSILFVTQEGMAIIGGALGGICSQVIMCIIGLVFVFHAIPKDKIKLDIAALKVHIKQMKIVSSNLSLRVVFLTIQMQIHNSILGELGEPLVSVNNILMNVIFIVSGVFEGIANSSCYFAGRSIVEKNDKLLRFAWKTTTIFTLAVSIVLAIAFIFFGEQFITYLAGSPISREAALYYRLWTLPYILFGGYAISYYGVFVGAVCTKPVAISAFMSLVTFIFTYYVTNGIVIANGYSGFIALWLAYSVFYLILSLGLFLQKYALLKVADKLKMENA